MFIYRIFKSSFDYFLVSYLLIENWYDAVFMRGGIKKDCKLKLRSRSIDKTLSGRIIRMLGNNRISYKKTENNKITIAYKGKNLVFNYANSYQLSNTITGIKEEFLEDQYGAVDVKNSTVLDIGASIGDSAIYFALNGANRIISLEPYPFTYKVARKNIKLNGLDRKVTLINQACMAKSGRIAIDPDFQNNDRNAIKYFKKGKEIRITTLDKLVKGYEINNAVLKIDCEGYEYEIINNSSRQLLRKFKIIVLEYHYGFRDIETKLRASGFATRHTNSFYTKKIDDKVDVLCGLLYAERLPLVDSKEGMYT